MTCLTCFHIQPPTGMPTFLGGINMFPPHRNISGHPKEVKLLHMTQLPGTMGTIHQKTQVI